MSAPSRVHLPDDWDVEEARGSRCGALYGQPQTWPDGFAHQVIIDVEEAQDADCPACLTPDSHGNVVAREGCTRCGCGVKYWENDRCTDCGTHVTKILVEQG